MILVSGPRAIIVGVLSLTCFPVLFHAHAHAPDFAPPLIKLRRQRNHLIQQGLILSRRILDHLIPQMIDLQPRRSRRIPLRRLNSTDLHLQKEFGHLDCQRAADTPHARLGRQVDIQLVLKRLQIRICERLRRRKRLERKRERRLSISLGLAEVDAGEGDAARGHVGHAGEGGTRG